MRRIISLLLIAMLCVPASARAKEKKISVVATIFAPFDFAREIAGGRADISMLIPPAMESHSYEPTTQDIITIQNCDIFIYVGGESDAWIDDILSSMDTQSIKLITLMDCVELKEETLVPGMEGREEEGAYDEHVWTSLQNAKRIVQKIEAALLEADAANMAVYEWNTAKYLEKLDALDAAFRSAADGGIRHTIVFGDRFPFRYLADAYGLQYCAAFPGCSAETEPSARTIAFLIDKVNEEHIPVVFHTELSNKKVAEVISEATGAKVRQLHACHNISKADFESGVHYLDLMAQNVDALKEALN